MKTVTSIYKNRTRFNKLLIYFCALFFISACNSQAQKNEQFLSSSNQTISQFDDTVNKPKITYKVNKQVDKNGNIIKYDSTYTYVYRGLEGKGFSVLNADSVFNNFNSQPFKLFNKQNNDFFNTDLFFDQNFFEKQMQFNSNLFNSFFNQIDTIQQNYLQNYSFKKI